MGKLEFLPEQKEKSVEPKSYGVVEFIGRRDELQDAIAVDRNLGGKEGRHFFGLYDGHGSDAGAKLAAKKLHRFLAEKLEKGLDLKTALQTSFYLTDGEIEKLETQKNGQFGATALAAVFEKGKLTIANAGDSRAILAYKSPSGYKNQAVRLTRDHRASDSIEKKRIEEVGGEIMSVNGIARVGGQSIVTRSLGDRFFSSSGVTAEPEIKEIELNPENSRLVIACDGVWDVLGDQEVLDLIEDEPDDTKAAEAIKLKAFQSESPDNISVIVVTLGS